MPTVMTGLDRIREGECPHLKGRRLGLVSNQASLDSMLTPAREVISSLFPGRLMALFGPQHGHGGEDQDNMVETPDSQDKDLGIPVFSLYSDFREPRPHMLDLIDTLIIDLQDIGTRVYTFASTMLNCLKAAAGHHKDVVVLDRPNPLGGKVMEGNLLEPELYSFVGPYRLPMRHGLTMGELASVFDRVFNLGCNLKVIKMKGWRRKMLWSQTGLRWLMPSPNMPLSSSAAVYPGQVIWEGTNISEGRGTCRPFEIFGAPYLDTGTLAKAMISEPGSTDGCHLQEYSFRPTFGKWKDHLCRGFMIHILDYSVYRPFFTSLSLLKSIMKVHGEDFKWNDPPYEYEYKKKPIDLILGSSSLRKKLEQGANLFILKEEWASQITSFEHWRRPFLLYS